MGSNQVSKGFVSVANLISEVLYAIDDIEKKKYYPLALQKILNAIRSLNVNYVRSYKETEVELDTDLRYGEYPMDLVKIISVGIYRRGVFSSFTRKPDMSKTMTGIGESYDTEIGEGQDIPRRGILFGARGYNEGFWVEDDENCRFFVRNYSKDKVIVRYRSNGIDCSIQNCIPYTVKDLIVSMVVYEFALMGKPQRKTAAELQLLLAERSRKAEEFFALEYEPQNMGEFMDAQFNSYNSTVRRG